MKAKTIALSVLVTVLLATAAWSIVTESIAGSERIIVTLINQEPDPVGPGGIIDLRFRIENVGSEPAEDMQIKLEAKYPFSVYWSDEKIKSIGTLAGGQRDETGVREKFRLFVDESAATGKNTVEFWYQIKDGPWIKAGDFAVEIRTRQPVLAITAVKTEPEGIVPGSNANVIFALENMADNTLRNIKIELGLLTSVVTSTGISKSELPFSPIGSGNEKTVSSIAPKKSEDVSFSLFIDADAASQAYKIPYVLHYDDSTGANFTRSGVIGLIVDAKPELSANMEETEIFGAGQKGAVRILFVNKGFGDIRFLDVHLKGSSSYDILSSDQAYIGNLDSDDFESAEFTLLLSNGARDSVMLPLTITYRDANGKEYTRDETLSLPIYSGAALKQRTGSNGNAFTGIIITLAIVGIGIILYRRHQKKKKH